MTAGELTPTSMPLPTLLGSQVVVTPEDRRPGSWAGGPSAVRAGDRIYLAYRLRRPIGEGRGFRNVVAVSDDGVNFEPIAQVDRDMFGAESLERPALVLTAEGRWRLYVSCATANSKHWRVDVLEADDPAGLATAVPTTVLAGSDEVAVKDPVVMWDEGQWHLWASVHPLESWEDADRMTTDYATSLDGLQWAWHGTVLAGRSGEWDARGTRVSSVVIQGDDLIASYDGRATAEQNWEEVTGVASASRQRDGRFGLFTASSDAPLRSGGGLGGLRYVSIIRLADGGTRVYYEATCDDGLMNSAPSWWPSVAGHLTAPAVVHIAAHN